MFFVDWVAVCALVGFLIFGLAGTVLITISILRGINR